MLIAILSVVGLSLLTPPFQVPDEPQHLFRAYQLSEGQLRAEVQDGVAGGRVPASLLELTDRFLGTRTIHADRTIRPSPLAATWTALDIPLDPGRTEFADFTGAAFYSPIPYLPQTVAVLLGRAAGLGPLGLLYAARIGNGIAGALAVAAASAILPAGGAVLLVFALMPMTLFLFASASPDAAVIAGAFLFTALAFRARLRFRFRLGELAAAAVAAIVFCSLKPVYFPLLFLAAPAVLRRGSRANMLAAHALLAAAALGATALWLSYTSAVIVPPQPGRTIAQQSAWLQAHPLEFVRVLLHTVRLFATDWVREAVGILGWHNLWLPAYMYALPIIAVLLGVLLPRPRALRPSALDLAWYAVLIAASAALVMLALYLYWTGIGNAFVGGVQGRYFIPLLGLVAIAVEGALPLLRRRPADLALLLIVLILASEAALTGLFIARAYQVL